MLELKFEEPIWIMNLENPKTCLNEIQIIENLKLNFRAAI